MVCSACTNPALEPVCGVFVNAASSRSLPKPWRRNPRGRISKLGAVEVPEAQTRVLDVVEGVSRRGQGGLNPEQLQVFQSAVEELEAAKGVEEPTVSDSLLGRWKLLYTSTPGTESPIQRTFTGVDAFQVFQDIVEDKEGLRVRNVVRFGDKVGALRVEAEANTDEKPMKDFVPRQSAGLALFGKSSITPPDSKNKRIDFWFDKAAFNFSWLPFKIPYPVPFRLLGDETKGWLDVTYMDPTGTFRLSRGNKGTLFVLSKVERTAKQDLLDAISEGANDEEIFSIIEEMKKLNPTPAAAKTEKPIGKWRVIWDTQGENAPALQKMFINFKGWQIITEERVENLVSIVPGLLKLRLKGRIRPLSDTRTEVIRDDVAFEIPGRRFPLEISSDREEINYVEWLYLDDDLRITTGSRGSYFIHVREG